MTKELLQVISLVVSMGLSALDSGNYQPEQKLALEEINWEAYRHVMSEEEYLALQDYLPVLTNEGSFIYTQYIYDQYDDIADVVKEEITIAEYIDGLYSDLGEEAAANPINTIKVRGVAFCDIDDEHHRLLYYIGEEPVDQETFETWKSSIMVGDVEFYAPSG